MKRNIITCLVSAALLAATIPGGAAAQDKPSVIRMTVSPASEPVPALKYRFLPRAFEQKLGNAALLYYRMLDRIDGKDDAEKLSKWLDVAPAKLPRAEVRRMLDKYATILKETELAAGRDHCNWAFPFREEGLNTTLPPLSKFRHLGKLLALRVRLEIAEGQFDKAVRTLQTGFAFARHQADGDLLICGLVGGAMTDTMLRQAQALSQAPDAPNLYWALATLRRPAVDISKGLWNEAEGLYLWFPALRDVTRKPIRLEDYEALFSGQLFDTRASATERKLAVTALGIKLYPHARKYLAGKGCSAKQIDAMPVRQVIAIYMVETFERLRDNMFKWFLLPYHEAHASIRRTELAMNTAVVDPAMPGFPLGMMLPALGRAYFHQVRLDRRVAALRCIEAVRMYAASHDGKLPQKLSNVRAVPVPVNPVTGRPFIYKVSGRTFTLIADAPSDMRDADTDRYEVTMTAK